MQHPGIKQVIPNIIKSPQDVREYRGLVLQNDMKVLLISDAATDKSAASLTVNVGHLCDPPDLPGLAHFCEHMLFMGTEKYPDENDYSKYLSSHGGGSNAFTSTDNTTYFFDVMPDHLEGALDRLAQFCISPLFADSSTEREVNAVDSENKNNLQNDAWRMIQLERSLSPEDHPYHKFGTGSRVTLLDEPKARGVDTREALMKFHEQYYSSNIMGLCILGKESLDALTEMVVDRFVPVQNKNLNEITWPDHPYGSDQLGRRIEIVPIKDLRGMHITFPIPDLRPWYLSQPGQYLSHLIGHEGKGSLLSELKARGWCNALMAGSRHVARGFGFFSIDIELSEAGEEHIDDVIRLAFEYIHMVREAGPQEWIHRESEKLHEIAFRFQDKKNPQAYVMNLSGIMHNYPMEHLLKAAYMMPEYDPKKIQSVLDKLSPDNMVIAVASQKFKGTTNLIEKWYQTEYSLIPFAEALLKSISSPKVNPAFALPTPNEFIPTQFELFAAKRGKPDDPWKEHPKLIQDDSLTRLWFLQDAEYRLPKCNAVFQMSSPVVYSSPLHHNLASLLTTTLEDALTEFAYDAQLAGSEYALTPTRYGLQLTIRGFDEKQGVLLDKIFERLANFHPDPKRFEDLKEAHVRALRNFKMEQPYQHAAYFTSVLLSEKVWTKEELLDQTDAITLDALQNFIPMFLSGLHVEAFVHGNCSEEVAKKYVEVGLKTIKKHVDLKPLFSSQLRRDREVKLPEGCSYLYETRNDVHGNSAIELYLQCGPVDTGYNMHLELLGQIISEPAFDVLRTKEQLGYIVWAGLRRSNGTQGLRIIVQSEKGPEFLDERIEAFLTDFRNKLHEMPDDEYMKHRDALANKRKERPKKLRGLTSKFWGEIAQQVYNFNRDVTEVEFLYSISKADLIAFYDKLIAPNATERKKLAVYIRGQAAAESGDAARKGVCKIERINAFKESLPLYQLPPPCLPLQEPGAKAKL